MIPSPHLPSVSLQQIIALHLALGVGVLTYTVVVVVLSLAASPISETEHSFFPMMVTLCLFLGFVIPYVSGFIFSALIRQNKAPYPVTENNRHTIYFPTEKNPFGQRFLTYGFSREFSDNGEQNQSR